MSNIGVGYHKFFLNLFSPYPITVRIVNSSNCETPMLEAIVFSKAGTITNLMKESRLLKTALLFADVVSIRNPELESLFAVHGLEDANSPELQYEIILQAIPALNPTASVEKMRDNLLQIKKLKRNNRKSSREIIALKKAQKQLGQINNTFRIITETLFESSNFSKIAPLVGKKVFFENHAGIINSHPNRIYFLDEELLKDFSKINLKNLVQKNYGIEGRVLTLPLLIKRDFDQISISSILKSQKIAKPALSPLTNAFRNNQQNEDLTHMQIELKRFNDLTSGFPFKFISKKIKTTDQASISLGICSSELFRKIVKSSSTEFPALSNPNGFVPFIFNQTLKKKRPKATQQAVL